MLQVPLENWKIECPRCSHIEYSQASGGYSCDNCKSPAILTKATIGDHDRWESADARNSWRRMECTKKCGWTSHHAVCSKCGTEIRGLWFKGDEKNCFVATAAFNNQDHPTVELLRKIRDKKLSQSNLGKSFVSVYYRYGPLLGKVVNQLPAIKPVLRITLTAIAKVFSK